MGKYHPKRLTNIRSSSNTYKPHSFYWSVEERNTLSVNIWKDHSSICLPSSVIPAEHIIHALVLKLFHWARHFLCLFSYLCLFFYWYKTFHCTCTSSFTVTMPMPLWIIVSLISIYSIFMKIHRRRRCDIYIKYLKYIYKNIYIKK